MSYRLSYRLKWKVSMCICALWHFRPDSAIESWKNTSSALKSCDFKKVHIRIIQCPFESEVGVWVIFCVPKILPCLYLSLLLNSRYERLVWGQFNSGITIHFAIINDVSWNTDNVKIFMETCQSVIMNTPFTFLWFHNV